MIRLEGPVFFIEAVFFIFTSVLNNSMATILTININNYFFRQFKTKSIKLWSVVEANKQIHRKRCMWYMVLYHKDGRQPQNNMLDQILLHTTFLIYVHTVRRQLHPKDVKENCIIKFLVHEVREVHVIKCHKCCTLLFRTKRSSESLLVHPLPPTDVYWLLPFAEQTLSLFEIITKIDLVATCLISII